MRYSPLDLLNGGLNNSLVVVIVGVVAEAVTASDTYSRSVVMGERSDCASRRRASIGSSAQAQLLVLGEALPSRLSSNSDRLADA